MMKMTKPFAKHPKQRRDTRIDSLFISISILVSILLLTACDKPEIAVYDAPKDSAAQPEVIPINRATPRVSSAEPAASAGLSPETVPNPAAGVAPPMAGGGDVPAPQVQSELHWSAPGDWQPQPLNQFRRGSYIIPGEEGEIDVSIIALAGDAGGLAANINRWRNQLNLDPWDETDFQEKARMMDMAGQRAIYVAFSGTGSGQMRPMAPAAENGGMNRIIAAILPYGGETWFFKMTGPEDIVEAREEEFLNFLSSVHGAEAHEEHGEHGEQQPTQPAPRTIVPATAPETNADVETNADAASGQMTGGVANAVSGQGLQYSVPEGWEEQEPGPVRAASFLAQGEGGKTADVSVVALGGQSGSLLANINRWRRQIGLDPIDSVEAADLEDIPVGSGAGQQLSLKNNGQAMEVAVLDHGNATWFFKMSGPSEVVEIHDEKFREFLAGLTLP